MSAVGKTDLMTVLAVIKANFDEDMTNVGDLTTIANDLLLAGAFGLLNDARMQPDQQIANTNVLGAVVLLTTYMVKNGTGAPNTSVNNQTGASLN